MPVEAVKKVKLMKAAMMYPILRIRPDFGSAIVNCICKLNSKRYQKGLFLVAYVSS